MKYIDLFAGIGGFRVGIERAFNNRPAGANNEKDKVEQNSTDSKKPDSWESATCVFTNEWDKYAAQIYEKNFGGTVDTRDITTIPASEIPDHDLLCGGFPCQSFSIAGKRRGFEDTRGTLFFDIARILKTKRPTYLLLENVKGLLSHDNGRTFETILRTLDELGYELQWQVLNSKNFGVPQNRERVFIVGHLRGEPRPKVFPIGNSDKAFNEIFGTLSARYHKQGQNDSYVREDDSRGGQNSGFGKKQNWDSFGINGRIRRLSPLECERLQGFPDGFSEGVSDTQRYKVLGNAVTINVVQAISERMFGTIK
jgi:DNA (cytosine-5)-methyltransferase 1